MSIIFWNAWKSLIECFSSNLLNSIDLVRHYSRSFNDVNLISKTNTKTIFRQAWEILQNGILLFSSNQSLLSNVFLLVTPHWFSPFKKCWNTIITIVFLKHEFVISLFLCLYSLLFSYVIVNVKNWKKVLQQLIMPLITFDNNVNNILSVILFSVIDYAMKAKH